VQNPAGDGGFFCVAGLAERRAMPASLLSVTTNVLSRFEIVATALNS
jgi:hypothetical protein